MLMKQLLVGRKARLDGSKFHNYKDVALSIRGIAETSTEITHIAVCCFRECEESLALEAFEGISRIKAHGPGGSYCLNWFLVKPNLLEIDVAREGGSELWVSYADFIQADPLDALRKRRGG